VTLAADRLRQLFLYDPDTGVFVRKIGVRGGPVGAVAGYVNTHLGYVLIGVDRRLYYGHRLAWLYAHGVWPSLTIDHINGDRADNRLSNLRDVTHLVNCQNVRKARSGTHSGRLGVCKNRDKWQVKIRVDGKSKNIGTYKTIDEANSAYITAKRQLHQGNTL
jgi:hypothetical protein